MKRYEQIPHTADLAARIYGKNIPELFENAAYAMFDLMADLEGLGEDESETIEIEAPDEESLLVAWLNELLYKSFEKQALFRKFHVVSLNEGHLLAEAKGKKIEGQSGKLRAEIKAATYHNLEIQKDREGYKITIVFDV